MEICIAILNFGKLQFWSRVLCWHVILNFRSKFRINRSIWRRDIAKNDFQYGVRPPSLQKFRFFVKCPSLEIEMYIGLPNLIDIG